MTETEAVNAPNASGGAPPEHLQNEALGERVKALEAQLGEAQRALAASERARSIDSALAQAGAVDPETATLLVERALAQMQTPDVSAAVRDVRQRKAHLFRVTSAPGGALAPAIEGEPDALLEAAAMAAEAGDRLSLLRYLRLRRQEN